MNILLLWDIDGTLIDAGGAGERAIVRAVEKNHGKKIDIRDIHYAGRTDRYIGELVLRHLGLQVTEQAVNAFVESYLEFLAEEMPATRGRVLPGVEQLLARTAKTPETAAGLLTGNMESGARTKLSHMGLWHYFSFGAFADDSADRNELGPHALRKARTMLGKEFPAKSIYVIGDTPFDIACGKVIGAQTVAVATGRYSLKDLDEHTPDYAFEDLSDTDRFSAMTGIPL